VEVGAIFFIAWPSSLSSAASNGVNLTTGSMAWRAGRSSSLHQLLIIALLKRDRSHLAMVNATHRGPDGFLC